MCRRVFLAGVALAPAVAPAAAFARDAGLAGRCIGAIQSALAPMRPGPALLRSYITDTGPATTDFDLTQANAAYVYDNALAGLALLAAGDRNAAVRIADALVLAQNNDRFWKDGRLRNAYQAGQFTVPAKLPGWWSEKANAWQEDPYQVGSQTGPIAWAMLLWTALGYQQAANRAGDWLNANSKAPSGYYGGFYGFEPNPQKLLWQSTEQNTDLYVAFTKLGRTADAAHAAAFVHAMFNPRASLFNAGTNPNGSPNPLLAADAGTWPYLAGLGSARSAATAIGTLQRGPGVGFSTASKTIWPEGTAFAALALQNQQDPKSTAFLATLASQISPSGYIYSATASNLATGLMVGPPAPGEAPMAFNYYRRPALAPTAWAAMSAMKYNPLST
jgi:hypothetical protein